MAATERRCPSCNALVVPDAEWCGQCFTRLGDAAPASDPAAGSFPPPAEPAAAATPSAEAGWPCQVCGARNPMAAEVCATCGAPFAASMRAGEERPSVTPRDAVVWSLVFPGLGHRLAGRPLDGLARGVLFAMSVVMTVLLLFAGASAATTGVLVLFVVAGIGVYVLSAMEAARLAQGGDVYIGSRLLLWFLVGMTFVAVGALAVAVMGASRG